MLIHQAAVSRVGGGFLLPYHLARARGATADPSSFEKGTKKGTGEQAYTHQTLLEYGKMPLRIASAMPKQNL
jgi:hypothetical protein